MHVGKPGSNTRLETTHLPYIVLASAKVNLASRARETGARGDSVLAALTGINHCSAMYTGCSHRGAAPDAPPYSASTTSTTAANNVGDVEETFPTSSQGVARTHATPPLLTPSAATGTSGAATSTPAATLAPVTAPGAPDSPGRTPFLHICSQTTQGCWDGSSIRQAINATEVPHVNAASLAAAAAAAGINVAVMTEEH